jgi:hypothetical protein
MKRLVALASAAMFAVIASVPAYAQDVSSVPKWRVGATLGIDTWEDLGDLQPALGGDFEDTGFSLELNMHGGGWTFGPAAVYAGADLGVMGHESDVRGIAEGEDLQTSLFYLTPSVKVLFGSRSGFRWMLDAGAGYYDVSIEEWEDDCFWDCDIYEYYDDDALGGFLGVGVEFPVGRIDKAMRFSAGGKVHFVDFDEPTSLAPAGDLDGPIYVLYFGVGIYL